MKKISLSIIVAIILIQFIPINRDNPASEQDAEILLSDDVEQVIKRSCYDCHSNSTEWPWYSNIAPVSWLVAYNVHQARKEINFSEWNSYTEKRMNYKLKEVVEELEEDQMPLFSYLVMHSEASLSEQEKELLINWARSFNKVTIDSTKRKD